MHRTSVASVVAALAASAGALTLSPAARAAELPSSFDQPPAGAGTERPVRGRPHGEGAFRQGIEAAASVGTGFADTYGLGFQGRVGYTFEQGIYAGGAAQYFLGHSVNDQQATATFVGGEVGYKIYPEEHVEVRPYVFGGPAFITQVAASPFMRVSKTDFAIQPGVIGMYHFGEAFVGADAHVMVTPSPNTLAVMASGGFGF
jgi:hypothetical protein